MTQVFIKQKLKIKSQGGKHDKKIKSLLAIMMALVMILSVGFGSSKVLVRWS